MVTERYAHVMDDDRRLNAERFEEAFYGGKATEAAGAGQTAEGISEEALALAKAIGNSPELMALLKGLIKKQ